MGRALALALGPRPPASAGDEERAARIWGHMVTLVPCRLRQGPAVWPAWDSVSLAFLSENTSLFE